MSWDLFNDSDFFWSDRWMSRPDWGSRPLLGWGHPSQSLATQRRGAEMASSGTLKPKMDLHENTENNTITAIFELPGLNKESVNIDVHNDHLEVMGESKMSKEYEEGGYAVRERRSGKFCRNVPLPAGVTEKDIKADLENGILTITFPKTTAAAEVKRITIR